MKTSALVSSLFLGANAYKSIVPIPTPEQAEQFVKGFLTSSLHWENMDGWVDCGVTTPLAQSPLLKKALDEMMSDDYADKKQGAADLYAF